MKKHTKHSLIKRLQEFSVTHNRTPTVHDTIVMSELPRYKVYEYHFGTWKAAIEAAGLAVTAKPDTNYYLNCTQCNKPIVIHQSAFKKSTSRRFFCSQSCSCTFNNTGRKLSEITKTKIRNSLKISNPPKIKWVNLISGPYTTVYRRTCRYTNVVFYSTSPRKNIHPTEYNNITHYRQLCKFNFAISKFPRWFDTSLLQLHKMYKATNRGNNLSGVSRDHILSISEAYKLKLDPIVVGHPANCRLVLHKDNQQKGSKSLITPVELQQKIQQFELIYPNWRGV